VAKSNIPPVSNTDAPPPVLPQGELLKLKPAQIIPSRNNPRHLFDPSPLAELKDNIRTHGVLVPITVYQAKGSKKYSILDGARRHRCCVELEAEGHQLQIPANVVNPPTKIAGLLYMFSIHNFREQWELMPTALALKTVMTDLGVQDNKKIKDLTGLSEPQIERCKLLLHFPEKFQNLSLDSDPKTRIPSNFWIELSPVLDLCEHEIPKFYSACTRDGITQLMVDKYRKKKIKSVIHFRRILEAFEVTEETRKKDLQDRLRKYIDEVTLETRQAFDEFITDPRRLQGAVDACDEFVKQLKRSKVEHTVDGREAVLEALERVRAFAAQMLERLKGGDDPDVDRSGDED